MKDLNAVSETALHTLKSRVTESDKESPVINDPLGKEIFHAISSLLTNETSQNILKMKIPSTLSSYIALRARKYDTYAKEFIKNNPKALVISLGCGFDTRFWRVSDKIWNYIEIDLPEVIELKKEILKNKISYETIGCSVLDYGWIDTIAAKQRTNILFLAEGLFMYLPEDEVISLFKKIASTFSQSQIIFETVNKKYTTGFYKKMVEKKMKKRLGSDAGASYQYGISQAEEIESYGDNIKVIEEWSYFEDSDVKPKFLYYLKNLTTFTRTQWTVKAKIK